MLVENPAKNSHESTAPQGFFLDFCISLLLETQNADGGWGFRPGVRSAIEPTSWALMALLPRAFRDPVGAAAKRGGSWLQQVQLSDGSWPAFDGQPKGCWVTAPACLALHALGGPRHPVSRALQWLCNTWPAEGGVWWRIRRHFSKRASVIIQDSSLRGWSWTPGTASWVEPTSYSLITLRGIPLEDLPSGASERLQLGERMLYDRMCPGGGWNSGNPLVYGVPGEPRVGPTVWALLALQNHHYRKENQASLDWLEQIYKHIRGPGSLVLAHLCLEAYRRPAPPLDPYLMGFFSNSHFLQNTLVISWAAIALNNDRGWLWGVLQGSA